MQAWVESAVGSDASEEFSPGGHDQSHNQSHNQSYDDSHGCHEHAVQRFLAQQLHHACTAALREYWLSSEAVIHRRHDRFDAHQHASSGSGDPQTLTEYLSAIACSLWGRAQQRNGEWREAREAAAAARHAEEAQAVGRMHALYEWGERLEALEALTAGAEAARDVEPLPDAVLVAALFAARDLCTFAMSPDGIAAVWRAWQAWAGLR